MVFIIKYNLNNKDNSLNNMTFDKSTSLLTILKEAKNYNDSAILFLIDKYTPLIKKYSFSYHLKNYDSDDLIQIGNIAVINAINKFDLNKDENYIDAFIITCIKNDFRKLSRKHIKYESESSLNIAVDEDYDIQSLIADDFNLEAHIINHMEMNLLNSIVNNLTADEFELIKAAYLTPDCTLFKYCKENNLKYHNKRRQLIALLPKLKSLLDS